MIMLHLRESGFKFDTVQTIVRGRVHHLYIMNDKPAKPGEPQRHVFFLLFCSLYLLTVMPL